VKVVLSLMLGRPAEDYLDTQRATHLARMRELTELKQKGGVVALSIWPFTARTLLLPYYLRTELAGLTHPTSNYQLLYISDGKSRPGLRLNPM